MKTRNRKPLVWLALLAAMGLSPVLAEEQAERELVAGEARQVSRERAADANRKAVDEATTAILEATRLELDIRMIGRTSPIVARTTGDD